MALCNPLREYLISTLSVSLVISVCSLFPAQTRSLPVSPHFSLPPSSFLSYCFETSFLSGSRDVGLLLVSLRAERKPPCRRLQIASLPPSVSRYQEWESVTKNQRMRADWAWTSWVERDQQSSLSICIRDKKCNRFLVGKYPTVLDWLLHGPLEYLIIIGEIQHLFLYNDC